LDYGSRGGKQSCQANKDSQAFHGLKRINQTYLTESFTERSAKPFAGGKQGECVVFEHKQRLLLIAAVHDLGNGKTIPRTRLQRPHSTGFTQ
jgi:hypothetical protein